MLNHFGLYMQFLVQDRPCHPPEAVPGDLRLRVIAHTAQRGVDRGLAHRLLMVPHVRKDPGTAAGQWVKFSQNLDGLQGQRNQVITLGLGDKVAPLGCLENRYPHTALAAARQAAQILVAPTGAQP